MAFFCLHTYGVNKKYPTSHEGGPDCHRGNPVNYKVNMRDLLFKNLTFADRGRKVIASSEIADKEGIHSVVRRHFTYMVKQVSSIDVEKPKPYLYVLKERNTKDKREHFFCKIKGSILGQSNEKLLLVTFIHTLNVELTASAKLSGQIG